MGITKTRPVSPRLPFYFRSFGHRRWPTDRYYFEKDEGAFRNDPLIWGLVAVQKMFVLVAAADLNLMEMKRI